MSKLQDLIKSLCPTGVNFVKLGEIATIIRGGSFQKKDFVNEGQPCIHYGQIYTHYGVYADKTFTKVDEKIFEKSRKAKPGDIVMATTSENVKDVCKCVAWVGDKSVAVSGDAVIIQHNQDPKYLAYVFRTKNFAIQKEKFAQGVKVTRVTPDKLKQIKIPLPPLDIQREIVRILDKFSAADGLINCLERELELRKKQYAYYRDKLLTFRAEVERVKLGDVAEYSKNRINANEVDEDSYIGVDNLLPDRQGKKKSLYVPTQGSLIKFVANDILIGNIRPYLKKIWFADYTGGTNRDVLVIHVIYKKLKPRFLFYCLSSDDFFHYDTQHSKCGKMPRGDKKSVMEYIIPIPTLETQEKIVKFLDKFDRLCNDSVNGLPAEIEARKKQYEFYRDKLLNF